MKRSVERVQGVQKVSFDLNTGRGALAMKQGVTVEPEKLWSAIKSSGFTPIKIESQGQVYTGPAN